jgi:hypothetical protein
MVGYYQNLEVAQQDDVERLVAWYREHEDVLPKYILEWLMKRDERVWQVIQLWETERFQPKPAVEHVALQPVQRKKVKVQRSIRLSMTEYYAFSVFMLVLMGVVTALTIWVVAS